MFETTKRKPKKRQNPYQVIYDLVDKFVEILEQKDKSPKEKREEIKKIDEEIYHLLDSNHWWDKKFYEVEQNKAKRNYFIYSEQHQPDLAEHQKKLLYCWKRIEAHSLSILKTKTINNTANKSAEQTEQLGKMFKFIKRKPKKQQNPYQVIYDLVDKIVEILEQKDKSHEEKQKEIKKIGEEIYHLMDSNQWWNEKFYEEERDKAKRNYFIYSKQQQLDLAEHQRKLACCWKKIEEHYLFICATKTINDAEKTINDMAEQTEQLEKMGDNFYKQMMEIGQRNTVCDISEFEKAMEYGRRMKEKESKMEEDSRKM